jgi:exocyst complex component 5
VSRISNYFLSALILHLSHLKVTMDGFTTLTHDLAQYILIFNNLKMEELGGNSLVKEDTSNTEAKESLRWEKEQLDQIQHAFKILNELPGLYTCEPNSLKDFCSEGKLVDLKKDVIKDYIKNREDYQNWFLQNL